MCANSSCGHLDTVRKWEWGSLHAHWNQATDKTSYLNDRGHISGPTEEAVAAAGLRNSFTGCEMTPADGGRGWEWGILRDAMHQSEIEMLSLKLLVRKICHLQPDKKNVTKQAGNREKKNLRSYL